MAAARSLLGALMPGAAAAAVAWLPMAAIFTADTVSALFSAQSSVLGAQAESRCPEPNLWGQWEVHRWGKWPNPLGLSLGILAAFVGQVLVILYHYVRFNTPGLLRIQPDPRPYTFAEGVQTHLQQPGGIAMLVVYLSATWMFDLMPCSYYRFDGGVRLWIVAAQMISQDALQYAMHWLEHKGFGAEFYKRSHKPHHRFTNPRLFDAFNGSLGDTFAMILVPLFVTAQLVHANVWEYMAFGATWAAWLVLIHSETAHPWDPLFRRLGLGTAADHHVHHKTFIYNYGHILMWWDRLLGTYKAPSDVGQFNKGV